MFPSARAARLTGVMLSVTLLAACGGDQPKTAVPAPESAPPPAAPAAARKPPEPALAPATVLARTGQATITAGDVIAALAAMPDPEKLLYADTAALRDLVERLADRPLMVEAARAAGLEDDPVMQAMLADLPVGTTREQMLAEVWLETELASLPALPANAVADYYAGHAAEFPGADGRPQPLDAVRDTIRLKLEAERRQDALEAIRARLRQGATVTVDADALGRFYGASRGN